MGDWGVIMGDWGVIMGGLGDKGDLSPLVPSNSPLVPFALGGNGAIL